MLANLLQLDSLHLVQFNESSWCVPCTKHCKIREVTKTNKAAVPSSYFNQERMGFFSGMIFLELLWVSSIHYSKLHHVLLTQSTEEHNSTQ